MGNSGCFAQGKPAATESHCPIYGACWVFACFHNPPSFNMDHRMFNMRTDVNACDCTRGGGGNPLPHWKIELATAACLSHALPPELHPRPYLAIAGGCCCCWVFFGFFCFVLFVFCFVLFGGGCRGGLLFFSYFYGFLHPSCAHF